MNSIPLFQDFGFYKDRSHARDRDQKQSLFPIPAIHEEKDPQLHFLTQVKLPPELKEFETFQQTMMNYQSNNKQHEELILNFSKSHPLITQYELQICSLIRPRKQTEYAILFSKFPPEFRFSYSEHFSFSHYMAQYLSNNNLISEYERNLLEAPISQKKRLFILPYNLSFLDIFPEELNNSVQSRQFAQQSSLQSAKNQTSDRSQIVPAIIKDDVEYFKNVSKLDHGFFHLQYFNKSIEMSLLGLAAFYGSPECFKFFFLNQIERFDNENKNQFLISYALAGGNLEIIKLLKEQIGIDPSACLIALNFRHDEIFDWCTEGDYKGTRIKYQTFSYSIRAILVFHVTTKHITHSQ